MKKIWILLAAFLLVSCSSVSDGQKKFGADADYFAGLQLQRSGKTREAALKYANCLKKGTFYCAEKSAVQLCTIGSVQEKNEACLRLIERFPSSDNLLIAVKQFYSAGEYSKVIQLTDDIDFSSEYNEIIKIRLQAKLKRGDSGLESEVFKWFTIRNITEYHVNYFKENLKVIDLYSKTLENENFHVKDLIINVRIQGFRKDYPAILNVSALLLAKITEAELEFPALLASDLGKAYFYGKKTYLKSANMFKQLAEKYKGTDAEFYFWFYAGRCFEKVSNYYTSTKNSFEKAVEKASSDSQKDNALWYLMNSSLKFSVDSIVNYIGTYCKQWHDPEYFDDFFDDLSVSLLAAGSWDSFYTLYKKLDGYASNEIVAQFAYIYARLVEEGYAKGSEEQKAAAYQRALRGGSAIYYKLVAADKLKLPLEEIMVLLKDSAIYEKPAVDKAAENLLEGYAFFGFPELIYSSYMELYKKGVSTDCAFLLADFLRKCGEEKSEYCAQSLRIGARAANYADRRLTTDELKLIYPDFYKDYVTESCKKYDLNPFVMFGLIRSESFFDAKVCSHAGAIGLAQLMPATASDVARKLKVKNYDLRDAQTNVEFGAFYYSDLFKRLENSYLQAFFSYNAGKKKVTTWLNSSLIEFGLKKYMPGDLFLETLPYAETRGYGRKLISASVMYSLLYTDYSSDQQFYDFVQELLR